MIKVALIEDEKHTAETLIQIISNISTGYNVVGVADTIRGGGELILKSNPDIVFFDVEIKDGLSFEILQQLPVVKFQIIFTTAHSHYALNAFEFSAIDYIVKPVNPESVAKALLKAERSMHNESIQSKVEILFNNLNTPPEQQKIILQTADANFYIRIDEILRCEADNNYCNVILDNGDKILVSKTLKCYEEQLPSDMFFRVHQSHLININKIRQVKKRTYKVIMDNGEQVPLASRRKDLLLEKLK